MASSPPNRRSRGRSRSRITLQEVAQAAGVSPITVSRALRGERSVAAELVERVKKAAKELGYVPDPVARALASSRGSHVTVLIPSLTNNTFNDLLEAVHRTLRPAGYQPLIGVTHYDPREEDQLLREQLMHRPAGIIITGFNRTDETRALIAGSGVPCVHLMEISTTPGVYSVGFLQIESGETVTRHLVERGRRRVAFAAAQLDPRTMQRGEGYRRVLRQAGLYDERLELLSPEKSSIELGARMFEQMMKWEHRPDAIFFCNDDLAQGGLLAALRLGVKVPEQVAVAGFNDLNGSDQMVPPLTTIRTPRVDMGSRAANMLLELMRGETVEQSCIDVGFELVVRGST